MTDLPPTLDAIRDCLEGGAPATIATCDRDGMPNASLLSQVHYIDADHVALTYQFFNKTRRNILDTPYAAVQVSHPLTGAEYRLMLRYLRTETSGALFETMKAKLAGIASHAGMQDVFRLRGADIYRVLAVEAVDEVEAPPPVPCRPGLLPKVRRACEGLARCGDLGDLLEHTLACLKADFGIDHAMVLLLDEAGERLYAVDSMGYPISGAGFEVAVGDGIIGVAARERAPIRINYLTSEYSYSRLTGAGGPTAKEIPFPGLAEPHSQMAVPLLAGPRLVGILFVESEREMCFWYDDEDALATLAVQMGCMIQGLAQPAPVGAERPAAGCCPEPGGAPVAVRHYAADDSIFIGSDYLIKGVAGAILRKLVRDHVAEGRCEFTNRELRVSADIRLPEISGNLEARLILLQRRLAERSDVLGIEKTGRGRFRLTVARPLRLEADL